MEQYLTIENVTKTITLFASLFALFKTFKEVFINKKGKLRMEYEFAEKFVANDKWKTMNEYLLERAYWGLSGKQLSAKEIKCILSGTNPLEKFQLFTKSKTYVECASGETDSNLQFKIKYEGENLRNKEKRKNAILYGVFGIMALSPLIFSGKFISVEWTVIISLLIWLVSFGAMSLIYLFEYGNIISAERLMDLVDDE